MRHGNPGPLEAIAAALRPLLAAAEAQWREQYRLARTLPDHWHGAGARAAVEALFDNLDSAERTLTRIRATIDTLDAAAQVLRAIGTRLEAALADVPDDDVAAALREAARRAQEQVSAVVGSVLDPDTAEPEEPQSDPQSDPVAANPPVTADPPRTVDPPRTADPPPEPSILVDPVVAQADSQPAPEPSPRGLTRSVEPVLLQSNSAQRSPSSARPRAELAALGPDDPSAPILAEAGSW